MGRTVALHLPVRVLHFHLSEILLYPAKTLLIRNQRLPLETPMETAFLMPLSPQNGMLSYGSLRQKPIRLEARLMHLVISNLLTRQQKATFLPLQTRVLAISQTYCPS